MERTFGRRDIGKSVVSFARGVHETVSQEVPNVGAAMVTRREVIDFGARVIAPVVADTALGNPVLKTLLHRNAAPSIPEAYVPESFDMLDYLLTDTPKVGLTGTHRLSQTIDPEAKRVYTVKFGDKSSYEMHEWDDENIYLVHDNSNPSSPYNFSKGIWMKRHMKLGESFRVDPEQNMLERFTDGESCNPKSREPFGYTVTLESYYQTYATEGPLGILTDVIKLVYAPDGDQKEEFFYNPTIGWFQWNLKEKDGDFISSAIFSSYDRKKPTQPNEGLICIWPSSNDNENR